MSKADIIEFGIYIFTILVISFSLYTIKNWRKPFDGKGLGRGGRPPPNVSPLVVTTYDDCPI